MANTGSRSESARTKRVSGSVSVPRATVYLRVSTGRQAEQDLSIPDQKAQTRAWAAQRGWTVVAEYVEPGASATDDKRPEFQRMIERACDGENAFDVIVVHSFSRFFRDAFGLEFYVRKLAKHGRPAGLDHPGAGRRSGASDDAAGDRAVRRVPVEGECQARAARDEGECAAGVLEWLVPAAWVQDG